MDTLIGVSGKGFHMRYQTLLQLQKEFSSRQVMHSLGCKCYDDILFHKLLQFRSEVANSLNIPEHMIFQYKTLLDMSQMLPADFHSLRRIWGVSNWGLKKYGFAFLTIIKEHIESKHVGESQ